MLYVISTTDIVRTKTSSAATIDVVADYIQSNNSTGAFTSAGIVTGTLSSATTTTILAGPGGSDFRSIKQATWRNRDTTLACDVTIIREVSGPVDSEQFKATLQPGESITYIEGVGFFVNKNTAVLDKVLIMNADVVNSTVTFADITGLTYPLLSGIRYSFLATLIHITAISTTGINFGYNIGAAPTNVQVGNISGVTNSVTAGTFSLGVTATRDTAITAQTTGSAANTETKIGGMIQPSADGTFALRFSSEVAASAVTVRLGSWLWIRQEK